VLPVSTGARSPFRSAFTTLEWSCTKTADHAIDTVLAPAFFLASRKLDGYPGFIPFSLGSDATSKTLVEGLETATRILLAVVATAEPEARAVIWRRPSIEAAAPPDFVPRGGLELILHAHDVCSGLQVPFEPPTDLCEHLRQHTYSLLAATLDEHEDDTIDEHEFVNMVSPLSSLPVA
jgi:hypothetical protein